jgi:iron complex outermembrane receptor protein
MAEAFISTTAGKVSIYPNPNLKPETGSNSEIGFKQGIRIGKFKGFADLAAFQMDYKNLMEFTFAQWGPIVPPLFGAGFKSVNTPRARIRGIEAEINAEGKIGITRLVLLTGYTYTSPMNTAIAQVFATDSTGNKLSFENTRALNNSNLKYRYKHLFRWDLQCNYKQLEFGWSVRYNSALLNYDKAFISFPLNTVIPDIERSFKKLDHVLVTDIRMGWNFNKNWKMNFQILNLFNSLYMNRPADLRPPRSFQLQGVWFI